jgi:hypothetical protein
MVVVKKVCKRGRGQSSSWASGQMTPSHDRGLYPPDIVISTFIKDESMSQNDVQL